MQTFYYRLSAGLLPHLDWRLDGVSRQMPIWASSIGTFLVIVPWFSSTLRCRNHLTAAKIPLRRQRASYGGAFQKRRLSFTGICQQFIHTLWWHHLVWNQGRLWFSMEDRKTFWRLAGPSVAEGLLLMLLSAVDLIMVSSLGTMAVAAVSILGQPRMMILCVSRSFSVAITAHIAQKYGEKNNTRLLNLRGSLYLGPL